MDTSVTTNISPGIDYRYQDRFPCAYKRTLLTVSIDLVFILCLVILERNSISYCFKFRETLPNAYTGVTADSVHPGHYPLAVRVSRTISASRYCPPGHYSRRG